MVKITKTLHVTNRDEWRKWLEQNHDREREIWLIYYKKHTNKPCIPYDDAVEEALCFGWIDSIVKRIDDEKYTQKYTLRKNKSIWSEINQERVAKMISQGRMTPFGMAKIEAAKQSGNWFKAPSRKGTPETPKDLMDALGNSERALSFFNSLAPSYKKQYIWWICDAKRADTRKRRIAKTIALLEQSKKPGI